MDEADDFWAGRRWSTGAPSGFPGDLPGSSPAVPYSGAPPARPPARAGVPALRLLVLVVVGVAAAGALLAAASTGAAVGSVIRVEQPAPAADGWGPIAVDEHGAPARWDPCTPIRYVVQSGWIPDQGRTDLAEALRRLSAVSGLQFVDEGDTDELPSLAREAYQPEQYGERWAPLLVAWVPPERTDLGLSAGLAGGGAQGVSLATVVPSTGGPSLVSGQVALNADNRLSAGFGAGTTDGEVLLHELAHAVGLNHVLDPTQVMYPQTTNGESTFGAGDRAGLAALGAPAGCHPAPAVR